MHPNYVLEDFLWNYTYVQIYNSSKFVTPVFLYLYLNLYISVQGNTVFPVGHGEGGIRSVLCRRIVCLAVWSRAATLVQDNAWLQQDRCAIFMYKQFRTYQNEEFPEKWIS